MVDLVLPTEEIISGLIKDTVAISDLSSLTVSSIQETDVLTFAKVSGLSAVNRNIQKKDFDNTITKAIVTGDLNVTAKWVFGENARNRLLVETEAITSDPTLSLDAVINKDYFEKAILSQIDAFRDYLYSIPEEGPDTHVPSYPGMVIFSTTLNTQEKVAARYGGGTWRQLSGFTMILGHGSCLPNNYTKCGDCDAGDVNEGTKAGKDKVELEKENIPVHTHKFQGGEFSGNFNWTYRGSSNEYACTETANERDHGSSHPPNTYKGKKENLGGSIKIGGSLSFSSADLYGDSMGVGGEIYSSSGLNVGGSEPHNNIPPVMFVYIWERTS